MSRFDTTRWSLVLRARGDAPQARTALEALCRAYRPAVITYVRGDVAAVADLFADQVVVTDDRDLGRETASEGRFGYASRHLQITLDSAREGQS